MSLLLNQADTWGTYNGQYVHVCNTACVCFLPLAYLPLWGVGGKY